MVAEARRLAPANLDVLRAVGDVYIDLSVVDPQALGTAREALEAVRRRYGACDLDHLSSPLCVTNTSITINSSQIKFPPK